MAEYKFLGKEAQDFENSQFVVIPVPYSFDGQNVPREIIKASYELESFDVELKSEPYKKGIFTMDEIDVDFDSPEKTMEKIKNAVKSVVAQGKISILLGGDHTITLGAIQAFPEDIVIISFDAHADLRDEFEGGKINYACVMRRIFEINRNLIEIGVRSLSKEEFEFIAANKVDVYLKDEIDKNGIKKIVRKIVKRIKGKKVYLSIDLDCFDPSIAKTKFPEPNGLSWTQMLFILEEIAKNSKIVGFDIVEGTTEWATCFLAAKIIYKLVGLA